MHAPTFSRIPVELNLRLAHPSIPQAIQILPESPKCHSLGVEADLQGLGGRGGRGRDTVYPADSNGTALGKCGRPRSVGDNAIARPKRISPAAHLA